MSFFHSLLSGRGGALPQSLDNKVAWYEGDNYSDEVWTDSFGLRDLVKPSGRNAPTSIADTLNGHAVVDFASASHQILETSQALSSLDDFTMYVLVKVDTYQLGLIVGCIETGAAYVFTGFSLLSLVTGFRNSIRDGSAAQNSDNTFSNTANYHLITIKHRSMGAGLSERTVKIDGNIYTNVFSINEISGPAQKLRVGSTFDNASFDGKIALIGICSVRHDYETELDVCNYINETYGMSFTLKRDIDFQGLVAIDGTTGKEFNGLDYIERGSVYDFFTGTVQGDLYHLAQTGVDTFTRTALASGLGEISSLCSYDWDGDGLKEILTAHKTGGQIKIHKSSTTVTGVYSSDDLVTGKDELQDFYLYDIDGDGVPEVFASYQGATVADGGILVLKYNGGDVTSAASWTVTERVHPAAWWIAGIINHGGNNILVFSARSNGANTGEVPGLYYYTIPATYTDAWTETTLTAVDKDYLHVRFGNILGNGNNDIVGISLTEDDIQVYNEGSAFAATTIAKKAGEVSFNIQPLGDIFGDGRSCFIHVMQSDFIYLVRWISVAGAAADWVYFPLRATLDHPGDNEILLLDVYNEGKSRIVWDDSENARDGHVYVFNIL